MRNPIIIKLVTFMIVVMGFTSLFNLRRSTYPNVDFDIVKITTSYPGASAHDVEVNVTKRIEDELLDVDDLEKVLSTSFENYSLIYVFVDTDAPDIAWVKDEISRAVDRVTGLPNEVEEKPQIKEIRSTNVSLIELAVTGTTSETKLRTIAKDLEDTIKEIDGVGSIEKVGYRKKEVRIQLDPDKLNANYLSLKEVANAISNRNIRVAGGNLESFTLEKKIVTFAEFEKPLDVGEVIVRSNFSGRQVKLKDIATIDNTFEDYEIISRTRGKNSINLLIRSQANSDIIDISHEIKSTIAAYQENLDDNIKITLVSDFSYYTKALLDIVRNNAVFGFFLVLGCLFVFLNRWTAIWTAWGILLSVLGALIFFPLFNVDINFISLIAMILMLGLLVDDAIVVAENITRHREAGLKPFEAAKKGVGEVFWPVTTTIITTILAFIPMFFMTGVTGKFVFQIPIVVILTLGFSLLESTIILPAHIVHSPTEKTKIRPWFEKLKNFYANSLRYALDHQWKTIACFVIFLTFSGLLLNFGLKVNLFPYDDIDLFHVIAELPEGSSIENTADKMKAVENLVATIPDDELINFTTRIGHHDTNVYGVSNGLHSNWAMISVYLKTAGDRYRNSEIIMSDLEKKLKALSGFKKLYLEKFNDGPPIGKPITITLVSDNHESREKFATQIFNFLNNTKGVLGLETNERDGKLELRLKPNYETMARLGLTSADIAQTIRMAYDGVVVTEITRAGEEIDFRIEMNKDSQAQPHLLENLKILNPQGRLISIGSFCSFEPAQSLGSIHHYNGRRSITLTADVDEKNITSHEANQLVRNKFLKQIETQPDLKIIFGGEEKSTQESMTSFLIAFICSLLAIYCVLVVLFSSFTMPFLIMIAIPFGLAGVVIVFFLHGQPISFLGIIGCLGLVGIVVNDALVMVTHLGSLKKKHGIMTKELILQGSKDRIRAVILTTITTVAGMGPTIYGLGGYEPFIVPVVLAVAGGLIFATAITLVLVPTLYALKEGQQ